MKRLNKPTYTGGRTMILAEEGYKYNAPHNYLIEETGGKNKLLANLHFQEGPIKECGINGVTDEDLILIVIDRFQHFQQSEYACRENAVAITKLEEALLWLSKRREERERRGVEGTNAI